MSHEAKLSGIYETEVWNKSHIPMVGSWIGILFYRKAHLAKIRG